MYLELEGDLLGVLGEAIFEYFGSNLFVLA